MLGAITGTTSYDGFGDVDFVIEAVPEQMEIKHAVFAELDAVTPGHAMLASNTSGLSITEIGDTTQRARPGRRLPLLLAGVVMRLIEVVEGEETLARDVQAATNFAQQIRKMPIRGRRVPGLRRQPHPALDGVGGLARPGRDAASPVEEIDELSRSRRRCRWGRSASPTCRAWTRSLKVAQDMRDAYGDRFYVHRGMQELVERGELGAKSGKGFYEHG